jgi:hypothetical protein
MANYTLNIAFTAEQLATLNASGKNIVLGKSFFGGAPQIAWQVFKPLESNTVKWNDDYSVYFSNDTPDPQKVIRAVASRRVERGGQCTLDYNGNIMVNSGSSGDYSLTNQSHGRTVGGLCQDATVNAAGKGESIVCARVILEGNRLTIRPDMKLSIWLQSGVNPGTVLGSIENPVTELDFAGSNTISVKYDSDSKKFVK